VGVNGESEGVSDKPEGVNGVRYSAN